MEHQKYTNSIANESNPHPTEYQNQESFFSEIVFAICLLLRLGAWRNEVLPDFGSWLLDSVKGACEGNVLRFRPKLFTPDTR
jgi:hypothetical protein